MVRRGSTAVCTRRIPHVGGVSGGVAISRGRYAARRVTSTASVTGTARRRGPSARRRPTPAILAIKVFWQSPCHQRRHAGTREIDEAAAAQGAAVISLSLGTAEMRQSRSSRSGGCQGFAARGAISWWRAHDDGGVRWLPGMSGRGGCGAGRDWTCGGADAYSVAAGGDRAVIRRRRPIRAIFPESPRERNVNGGELLRSRTPPGFVARRALEASPRARSHRPLRSARGRRLPRSGPPA